MKLTDAAIGVTFELNVEKPPAGCKVCTLRIYGRRCDRASCSDVVDDCAWTIVKTTATGEAAPLAENRLKLCLRHSLGGRILSADLAGEHV